jgi:archaellum component FlaC
VIEHDQETASEIVSKRLGEITSKMKGVGKEINKKTSELDKRIKPIRKELKPLAEELKRDASVWLEKLTNTITKGWKSLWEE